MRQRVLLLFKAPGAVPILGRRMLEKIIKTPDKSDRWSIIRDNG